MKVFTGKVLHKNMAKTAKVAVERFVADAVYGKRMRIKKTYLVHDEYNVEPGQTVRFVATKPYSKLKKWKVIEVVDSKSPKKLKKDNSKPKVQSTKPKRKSVKNKK
jgi:small subunit ribosomal protein S17